MINQLRHFTSKLISQGLADSSKTVFLSLDDKIYTYSPEPSRTRDIEPALRKVFDLMNINSILYALPGEPYRSIIRSLLKWGITIKDNQRVLIPQDCETRTFFHDIPIIDAPIPRKIASSLSRRKSAIIEEGPAIVCYGSVSPEQAFVSFSSTCFSTFVKYFFDHLTYLEDCRKRKEDPETERVDDFDGITSSLFEDVSRSMQLTKGPPENESGVIEMLNEAGKLIVEERLVDSYFGNISFLFNEKIFISETAASLDELDNSIDLVPLDGSSSVGITASSEVSTHRKVFENTKARAMLHGHPRFSVIMSMHCTKDCDKRDECHKACPEKRYVCKTPIVPGEIGTGPTGIVNTVPQAFQRSDAAIVHGHGVFCSGQKDFNGPFENMIRIEKCCKAEYFDRINTLL